MMGYVVLLVTVLFINYGLTNAYQHLRLTGALPSFSDPGYPPDDVIKENTIHDPNGEVVDFGFTFNAWGYTTNLVKVFDDGYLLLDPSEDHVEYDEVFIRRNYPYVAPLWMPSNLPAPNVYHVAFRVLFDETDQPERAHDFDRIRNEINKGLHQYPAYGRCLSALIVTWKIGDLSGNYNKFQAVLAHMDMVTEVKDFVFFYYDTVNLVPGGTNGLSVWVNGNYGPSAADPAKFATTCGATTSTDLLYHSNHKCSDRAMFLFDMTAGTGCGTCAGAESSYDTPNCMIPWTTPQDSCTVTFHCAMDPTESTVTFTTWFKYYAFSSLTALDYTTFIGTGTAEDPIGAQNFITTCQKDNLLNAGTPHAEDSFEFTFNIDPLDSPLPCGITWDTVEDKMSFAFAIYDPVNPEADVDGKVIFFGDCYPRDLPTSVSANISQNFYNQSQEIVRSPRSVYLKWIDRPNPGNFLELLTVKPGRDAYSLVCFDTGTPHYANVDPFGVNIIDCYISNNEQFNHYPLTGLGDPFDRMVQIFDDGCVSRASTQSYYFDQEYIVHPGYNVKGGLWCLVSGKMDAVPFNSGEKKLFTKCTARFCTRIDDVTCDQSCLTNKRKRRAVVETSGNGTETITVELKFDAEEPTTREEVTSSETGDCVDMTLASAVLAALVVIILIAFLAALIIGLRLMKTLKKKPRPTLK